MTADTRIVYSTRGFAFYDPDGSAMAGQQN